MVNDETGHSTTFGISDSRVTHWIPAVAQDDGVSTQSEIWYGTINSTGSDTVKVTFSPSSKYVVLSVWEISGYYTDGIVTSTGTADGSPFTVTNVTIPSGSFALVGVASDSACGSWTGTSGFTFTKGCDWGYEYTQTPPSSTTAKVTAAGATWWTEVLIAFPDVFIPPAIGIVQNGYHSTGNTQVSSLSVTLTSNLTDGDMLVAMANMAGGASGVTFTASDTVGSTWTSAVSSQDGSQTKSQAFYAQAPSNKSDTVTVSFSSPVSNGELTVFEIRGYEPQDLVVSSGSGSSGCCSVSAVNPISHSFVLAGAAVQNGGTWTKTTNFTLTHSLAWGFEYNLEPPSSTTAALTVSGAQDWSEVLISLQDPSIGTSPYVGVYGYRTENSGLVDVAEMDMTTQMSGSPSALGNDNVSAGLNVHVPIGGQYSDDYEFQEYVIYSPNGEASIFTYIVNACWGALASCGPEFWKPGQGACSPFTYFCPLEVISIGGISIVNNIGSFGDKIEVRIECQYASNGSLCSNTLVYNTTAFNWVFQYNDLTTGSGWHTASTFTPWSYYTAIKSYITFGTTNQPFIFYEAFWVQIAAIFMPGVPATNNWQLNVTNIEYTASGSTTETMMDHAKSLPWETNLANVATYNTNWMEEWDVSQNPAQCQWNIYPSNLAQANVMGKGSGSSNTVTFEYHNSDPYNCQIGGSILW